MKSKFDSTPAHSERIGVVLPPALKAKVFAIAASQRLTASHVIREAIHHYTTEHAA